MSCRRLQSGWLTEQRWSRSDSSTFSWTPSTPGQCLSSLSCSSLGPSHCHLSQPITSKYLKVSTNQKWVYHSVSQSEASITHQSRTPPTVCCQDNLLHHSPDNSWRSEPASEYTSWGFHWPGKSLTGWDWDLDCDHLKLHVADLGVEGIHQQIKLTVELDKVFSGHDDPAVNQSEESIAINQPIRREYCNKSTNQKRGFCCINN